MANILRITSEWTGFPGAPGVTNFYARHVAVNAQDTADPFGDVVYLFWSALSGYLPATVIVSVNTTWQDVDEVTGNIVDEGSLTTAPGGATGTNADTYAGNVGVAVNWSTSAFIDGRRLKGRTYLVPLIGVFQDDGTLAAAQKAVIVDAAEALMEGPPALTVWHRPVNGTGGESHPVTGVQVTDRAAILRSRSV